MPAPCRSCAGVISLLIVAIAIVYYRGLPTSSVAEVLAFSAADGFSIVRGVVAIRRGGVANLLSAAPVVAGQFGPLSLVFFF